MSSANACVSLTAKSALIKDADKWLSVWNQTTQVPTCEVRRHAAEGVGYNLTLYDPMVDVGRKVYLRIPAEKKGSLVSRTGPYGAYFTISDPELKAQIEALSEPFALAMQAKCASRGVEPDYQIPEFFKWPWKSTPQAFLCELFSSEDTTAVLLLNGAYHNTKDGKNLITLEWAVSQHVDRPMIPRVRKGKRAHEEISVAAPEGEGM